MHTSAFFSSVSKNLLAVVLLGFGASCSAPSSDAVGTNFVVEEQKTTNVTEKTVVIGPTSLEENANITLGMPRNIASAPEILISRPQYLISWNESRRDPNWVAWRYSVSDAGKAPRSGKFFMDMDLENYLQGGFAQLQSRAVNFNEYSGSCFDRGHQTPSGDRKGTAEDNTATFFMSNMLPQTSYLNKVVWEHLESYSRSLVEADSSKVLFIYAGSVFSSNPGKIGPNKDIDVPSFNYKIVATTKAEDLQAGTPKISDLIVVKMPNLTSKGTDPVVDHEQECADFAQSNVNLDSGDANDWKKYTTTLEDISQASGFDFSSVQLGMK